MAMREIKIRIDNAPIQRGHFDVLLTTEGEEVLLEKLTSEKIHNLIRAELNRAIESLP